MKLKMIAAAVLAATSLSAMAGVSTGKDAELVLVVFDAASGSASDPGIASYVLDLGITMDQFIASSASASGYSFSRDLTSSAAFTQYRVGVASLAQDGSFPALVANGARQRQTLLVKLCCSPHLAQVIIGIAKIG